MTERGLFPLFFSAELTFLEDHAIPFAIRLFTLFVCGPSPFCLSFGEVKECCGVVLFFFPLSIFYPALSCFVYLFFFFFLLPLMELLGFTANEIVGRQHKRKP